MKLIIDIDKDYFEILKYEERNGNDFKPIKLIANGTPLEEELFNIENELFKNLKYSDYVESEYVLTKDIEKVLKAH
ncbi:MAG: hypothetical protein J6S67_14960 [Methanobrevibacter sp.]|nr:hypothetical protein [Methanobrevibacter sp.]